jgi:DNA-binding response OmpR family regulator
MPSANAGENLGDPKLHPRRDWDLWLRFQKRSDCYAAAEEPSGHAAARRRQIVLVVEDEILVRLAVSDHLRDAGYVVLEAANAAEALDVLAAGEPVAVVFTDVQMPGPMDGLMLVGWVREHHPGVAVLVASGKDDTAVSSGLIAAETFFSKPYNLEEIASRIRSLLEDC